MSFEDIEAIKRVKYNYCNGIDRCDLDLLESIMTEDVEIDYVGGTRPRTAKGRWRLLDYAMNLAEDNLVTIGAAEYSDEYEKGEDGVWRIKSSGYERIYERVFNEPEPALTHFFLGGGHTDKTADYADTKPFSV